MKRCPKCEASKPLTEFSVMRESKRNPGQPLYRPYCKACIAKDRREAYARDPEHGRELARQTRARESKAVLVARSKKSSFKRKYGITLEDYAVFLLLQNGVCAVCHEPETAIRDGVVMQLAVDHDHLTGQVRGLLCGRCNLALGLVNDNVERLKQLIYYLEAGE